MARNLPTLKSTTGIEAWDLARAASGQKGIFPAIGAWILIVGIVIFSSTVGLIATAILAPLIMLVITFLVAIVVFRQMADSEFLGIDGRVLFVALAAVGAVVAFASGSVLIGTVLAIVAVGVIIV